MADAIRLAVVVPCFNEEAVLRTSVATIGGVIRGLVDEGLAAPDSFALYVDDGSSDATWRIIREESAASPAVRGISLSRNCGHQYALLAGLMEVRASCDASVSIDCDGQDDVGAIRAMLLEHRAGAEVVYGVRRSRATDTWMKRNCARAFYRLLSAMGAEVVYDHADYRLASARVLDALAEYGEVNLFLRGMFPLLGFRSAVVRYDRRERIAGESHYPIARQLALAVNGITSLSVKPIRMIFLLGVAMSVLGLAMIAWGLVSYARGHVVSGWTSIVMVTSLFGGVQLLSIGVIGEYIGKIYLETKRRPRYIVSERTP